MPTFELPESNIQNNLYHFSDFNREGSLAYGYCWTPDYRPEFSAEHGNIFKIFRISLHGRIVHKICQIEVPCFVYPKFDMKNEEVCWLGRVPHHPWENVTGLENPESCLLTFVVFGLLTGTVKRYYHLSNVNCEWYLMHKGDDQLLTHHVDPLSAALRVYTVSCLDSVNHTFGLCPYLNLPFYGNLRSTYGFSNYLASSNGQITVYQFSLPNEILYFKLNGCWTMENVICEPTEENLQVHVTECDGPTIVQMVTNENVAFRCLKIDEKEVWKLVARVPAPSDIIINRYSIRFSSDRKLVGYTKHQNTRLQVTILACSPCTLLEACISILWPCARQINHWMTDVEICDRLGLSKIVNMDTYFGKKFTN